MLDGVWPVVLNALREGLPARLIDRMLIGPRNGDAPPRDSRQLPLLPLHDGPVDKPHDAGEVVIAVTVEEELLEDIERAIESERLRAGQVVRDVERELLFNCGPADRHRWTLPCLGPVQFATMAPKTLNE